MNPVKVLSVGSPAGSIRQLFSKIKAIDAKHGKFDFVLCVGDFFGPVDRQDGEEDQVSALLQGRLEAPLECYIMQGEHPLPDIVIDKFSQAGGELCKNVFLLSKSGIMTTAHGLRIACLGGIYDEDIYSSSEAAPGFTSPFFSSQTVDRLLSNAISNSSTNTSPAASEQLLDIFISNVWPSSITKFTPSQPFNADDVSLGVPPLDNVIRCTKPRYHFAGVAGQSPRFWEREPFIWDDEGGRVTRFMSLGSFGGEPSAGKKQRWFYAFSIAPMASATTTPRPANVTRNPFIEPMAPRSKRPLETSEGQNYIFGEAGQLGKRIRLGSGQSGGRPPPGYKCRRCDSADHFINDCPERTKPPEGYICRICNMPGHLLRDCPTKHAVGDTGGRKPPEGYICRACGSDAHYVKDCPVTNQTQDVSERRERRGPPKEIAPEECWFCLSNPNVAKHLIVSIGEECYLTLPKGQIIPTQSAADRVDVPGGGHVLIVPIAHYTTLSSIPPDLAAPIIEETNRYKSSLRAMFAKHRSVAVFFEIGRLSAKGGHAHVHAVPLPSNLKDDVERAFINEGKRVGIDFEVDSEAALKLCENGGQSYFRVDLPDGRMLVHLMKSNVPFGIQFGRQVMVSLLKMPHRLDWKTCQLTENEDKADAQAFKAAFAPFDPTL